MDDIYSCEPTGEVTAGENTIPEEQPANDVSALSEPAVHVHAAEEEEQNAAFSSDDYSFPDIKDERDPGEYADERYDEPYYDDADYNEADYDNTDYDDEYYDNEGYSDADYNDAGYDDAGYDNAGYGDAGYGDEDYDADYNDESYDDADRDEYSYDPNGAEDERPVYGSYYGIDKTENVSETGDRPAQSESETPKKVYTSKYDAYRFTTPEGNSSESPRYADPVKKDERSDRTSGKKKTGFLGRLLSAVVLAVVFGGIAAAVFLGTLKLTGFTIPEKQEAQETAQNVPTQIPVLGNSENSVTAGKSDISASVGEELTVPQVVELCMPSMVSITNTSISQYYDFFGGSSSRENVSAGSGIIVGETDTELLIATNNHVITNSSEITVTFIDEEAIAGTVKGTDADNDLAIVAVKLDDISEDTKNAIRVVKIGDSDALAVGESVVAIGNALGYGQSVSRGVISALGREVTVDRMTHQLIQTDASINPGNSGGALLNMRGELICINEIKYVNTNVEGVGYAIPMATAKPILESLGSKSARSVVDEDQASYIGIMCIDVPGYYVQSGYPAGVYVSEVTKGGPAEKAGVREGDIITAMDGISISTTSQLITYLKYYAAGEEIDFSISRLNEDETAFEKEKITITLGNRKDSGIDESTENNIESAPSDNTENGGFDVIPDQKR